jgi:hypothetical protein
VHQGDIFIIVNHLDPTPVGETIQLRNFGRTQHETEGRTMAPSLCGGFVTNKRSLIAFTWTITCVLTLSAFITCTVFLIHVHTTYKRLERTYYEELEYKYEQQQENGEDQQQHSADREWEEFYQLASMRSGSLTFVAIYIVIVATSLSFYGSTAIVGFTSLRGVYIAPCFSSHDGSTLTLKLGMFGGAIVFFANLLLICAVIFGEVRVRCLWKIFIVVGRSIR